MNHEKFKVLEYIRKLILLVEEELVNFPHKDIEIKNRIKQNSYDILELAYEANLKDASKLEEKKDIINKIIAKIKVIDFLINICSDKKIIATRKYLKFGRQLDDIMMYAAGWLKSIEKSKKVNCIEK